MFNFKSDNYLTFDEFVPLGRTLQEGGILRVNHQSSECEGESKSLVIRRTSSGKILAYCHRCSRKGIFNNDMERTLPRKVRGKYMKEVIQVDETLTKLKLPRDIEYDWSEWPLKAKLFLKRARLDEKQSKNNRIGYSKTLGKVVIPLIDGVELKGYQLRRIHVDDKAPKYLTRKSTKNFFKHTRKPSSKVCCIVEDVLSSIRVGKFVSSFCLMGTNLIPAMINELMHYERIIIFLDDDNSIVKQQQEKIRQEISMWVDNVEIIHSKKQPKEMSDADLQRVLIDWGNDEQM